MTTWHEDLMSAAHMIAAAIMSDTAVASQGWNQGLFLIPDVAAGYIALRDGKLTTVEALTLLGIITVQLAQL